MNPLSELIAATGAACATVGSVAAIVAQTTGDDVALFRAGIILLATGATLLIGSTVSLPRKRAAQTAGRSDT